MSALHFPALSRAASIVAFACLLPVGDTAGQTLKQFRPSFARTTFPTWTESWDTCEPDRTNFAQVPKFSFGDVDGDGDVDLVTGQELWLNDGTGNFTTRRVISSSIPCVGAHRYTALVDLDNDGDLDLLVSGARVYRGVVRAQRWLNDGKGNFSSTPPLSVIDGPIHVADLDGDGDNDVVFGASVLLNNGSGGFVSQHLSGWSGALSFVDIDGDKDLDFVAPPASVFVNDGKGAFTRATVRLIANDLDKLCTGDFDGDSDQDIVGLEASGNSRFLRLHRNDGNGVFKPDASTVRLVDLTCWASLLAIDLDGDKDLDLVLSDAEPTLVRTIRAFANDGKGGFTEVTTRVVTDEFYGWGRPIVVDLDRDGRQEIVYSARVGLRSLRLEPNGTLSVRETPTIPFRHDASRAVRLVDVDQDDDLDLVVANVPYHSTGANRLYRNGGQGHFSEVTGAQWPVDRDRSYSVAVADVDGDGYSDLVFGNGGPGNRGGQNRLYLNDRKGGFSDATTGRLPARQEETRWVELADLDGDNDADLIVLTYNGTHRVLLNDGKGSFADSTAPWFAADPVPLLSATTGDWNNDKRLDLLLNINANTPPRLYVQQPTGGFQDEGVKRFGFISSPRISESLDIDKDGDQDLVVRERLGYLKLYVNHAGTFKEETAARMSTGLAFSVLTSGDYDRDGDIDILSISYGEGEPGCLVNDGNGRFTYVKSVGPSFSHMGEPFDAVSGDVDGDGDLDAIIVDGWASRWTTLLMNHHVQLDSPVPARLGGTTLLDLHATPGYTTSDKVGALLVSSGPAQPPILVPGLGKLHLSPAALVMLGALPIPHRTGVGRFVLSVPNSSALLGSTFTFQGVVVHSPVDLALTSYSTKLLLR